MLSRSDIPTSKFVTKVLLFSTLFLDSIVVFWALWLLNLTLGNPQTLSPDLGMPYEAKLIFPVLLFFNGTSIVKVIR